MDQLPLTSIVILARNELAYTRRCLESIERCTPEPHEVIVVDNGSTDGTVEHLRAAPGVTLVENGRNLGFGGACNQGMAIARGEQVLLLNNDTVATPGWVAAMRRELALPGVGYAGPVSNRVAGIQQVPDVGYDEKTLEGLDAWAAERAGSLAGTGADCRRLIGFCLLLRREVVERIGGFDVRFAIGNFEDDDLCVRAAVAGWRGRIALDSWVHHFGSRTFVAERVDYARTLGENWRRFAAKWGLPAQPPAGGGYDVEEIISRVGFDAAQHHAPLVARDDLGEHLELERRGRALLALVERHDHEGSRVALEAAMRALSGVDDATLVVRVDGADPGAGSVLDDVADAVEAAGAPLPDVAVVTGSDEHDGAAMRACDAVLVHGRCAMARAGLARHLDREQVTVAGLAAWAGRARSRRAA